MHMERVEVDGNTCTYPYASAITSESGWTSFLVLTFFISIINGGLAHFYVHIERSYTWE